MKKRNKQSPPLLRVFPECECCANNAPGGMSQKAKDILCFYARKIDGKCNNFQEIIKIKKKASSDSDEQTIDNDDYPSFLLVKGK